MEDCNFSFKKLKKSKQSNVRKRAISSDEGKNVLQMVNNYKDNNFIINVFFSILDDTSKACSSSAYNNIKEKKKHRLNNFIHKSHSINTKQRSINSSSDDDSVNISVLYKSKKKSESVAPVDMGATAELKFETDISIQTCNSLGESSKPTELNNDYQGLNNCKAHLTNKNTNTCSTTLPKGPLRAPTNLRATVRWDYQPDICKDYKETGFCGFGDSCKFLHDR